MSKKQANIKNVEKFEEIKKRQENKKPISEKTHEMVEEFIQLLIRDANSEENILRLRKV